MPIARLVHGETYVMDRPGPARPAGVVTHAFATCELASVTGSSQTRVQTAGAPLFGNIRQAVESVLGGLGQWGVSAALELKYVTEPQESGPTRIRLAMTAKTSSIVPERAAREAEQAIQGACAALPGIYQWEPADLTEFEVPGDAFVEVRRQEEVTAPMLQDVPADFYYAAHRLAGDGSGWQQFFEFLAHSTQPVAISILAAPTTLDPLEQETIAAVATNISFYAAPRQEQNILGYPVNIPGDANAAAIAGLWNSYLHELRRSMLMRVAVRGDPVTTLATAKALASALSVTQAMIDGAAPLTVQRARTPQDLARVQHSWLYRDFVAWGGHPLWQSDEAPWSLRRLPYLFRMAEAGAVALMPVPDEQGAVGFPRARRNATRRVSVTTATAGPSILLGQLLDRGHPAGPGDLPLTAVNRHTLVVGAPGSGKTTTVLSMLVRLWTEHRIPFLAIEPTKTEYRSLLRVPGMEALRVVTLGRDDIAPMRLNPLAPPPGVRTEAHISSVMSAFKAALPLDPPLPSLLEDALERTYTTAGWGLATTMEDGRQPPTLRELLAAYERGFDGGPDDYGYSGEVRSNLLAALRLRLRSLTRGSRGLLLDTVEGVDFAELMQGPVVMELDEVTDRDDKAILAAFILDRVQAAARSRGSTGGQLKHVTVLEEAHRLLGRVVGAVAETPQTAAIRAFCDAIAELRARGEGFMISSQSPSALAEAAVANTGTRIVHRLESAADRDIVLSDLDAAVLDREAAARLRRGEAVVRWPELDEAEMIAIDSADGVDSGENVSHAEVRDRMTAYNADVLTLLPYRLCTRQVCLHGCDVSVREAGREVADDFSAEAGQVWQEHGGRVTALQILTASLGEASGARPRIAYCAAAHLAADGVAFVVPKKDIRGQLARSLDAADRHDE